MRCGRAFVAKGVNRWPLSLVGAAPFAICAPFASEVAGLPMKRVNDDRSKSAKAKTRPLQHLEWLLLAE